MSGGNFKLLVDKINARFDRLTDKLTIKNERASAIFKLLVFAIAVHLLFTTIGVYKFIHLGPGSIHASAQGQRASVALNYYKNDMNFFEPRIQRYITGEGITGLEFPIIYYAAAIMYKMFGFNDVFLKIIDLLIVLYGLLMFYRLSLQYIKNSFLTLFVVGTAALSPVFLFYTPNYLPDAPSLGFVLAAWYFFFQYLKTDRSRHLNLFVLFGTLGALIKSIAVLCFMVVICLVILDWLRFFKRTHKGSIFKNKGRVLLAVLIGFVLVAAWYYYAHYITKKYNNQTFALSPLMVDSWERWVKVLIGIKNYWVYQYFSYEAYVLMLCSIIVIILSFKFVNRLLLTVTVLNVLGSIGYVYFFTYQFENHVGVILFFNMKESVLKCKINYYNRNLYERTYLTGMDYRPYEDLEPKLRAKGVKRTDFTLSAFDDSACSSLYLMDQIGITVNSNPERQAIDTVLTKYNIKYLVINDSAKFNKIYPNNFSDKILLFHRGLIVYKLK
ncbi:MAG: hypothetical protein K0S12_1857 [Bacteroidetes bacterium]|nr:hypothetical protein [Bacteroidota bacterium]